MEIDKETDNEYSLGGTTEEKRKTNVVIGSRESCRMRVNVANNKKKWGRGGCHRWSQVKKE